MIEYEATSYEKRVLKYDEDKPLLIKRGKGCGHCNSSGYFGRIGVYEVMEIGREQRDTINMTRDPNVLKDIAIKNGMSTLENECRKLVLKGITTIEELATIALIKDI